ncbi:two-component system, response regulator YesN [Salinibacillus kushneri]|uniref:Two-component system, response regulator YesN n=1 Tax=Salinibacillus kushneri TaxID=237682 RepID=A0A1H9YU48_9BACI|nr:response regulator [Salinibacillus kushneri]SES72657.1 two-component system, response regulator YesN [Salinibacillus kushneri]
MKTIIVEDEYLERKAMRKFLEESFTDLTVEEAPNGRIAIEQAREFHPDFMIVDIRMPGIDGLEAIKTIQQQAPQMKFIIASAYDSFEYAKKAMKLGVKEYILKPSKKEETIKAISRIQTEIQQEKQTEQREERLAKEHFLLKIMQYEIDETLRRLKREHFSDVKSGCFFVLEPIDDENWERVHAYVEQRNKDHIIIHKQNDQLTMLLLSVEHLQKSDMLSLARTLHLLLEADVYIGIGFPYSQLKDFSTSYYEAVKASKQLLSSKQVGYGYYREKQGHNKAAINTDQFLSDLQMGNVQEAKAAIKQLLSILNPQETQELYFKVKHKLEAMGIDMTDIHLTDDKDEKEWKKFVEYCCLEIQQLHQSYRYIERAKEYIEEHYQNPISLEEVAQHVELSSNYFSNMFKEETGQTFVDYMTDIRLERAKQLLKENAFSLKEISFKVGYKDPNYFSRVFKKHEHLSPKQFQKQILK